MSLLRLFIAHELPQNVIHVLERIQDELRDALPGKDYRWVRPEGIHLTLKFLGDVDSSRVEHLSRLMNDMAKKHPAYELSTGSLGCFPHSKRPRVLWVGLEGNLNALKNLQEELEHQLMPLGFDPDSRGFSPHLTLARVKQTSGKAEDISARLSQVQQKYQTVSWTVTSFNLIQSILKPSGAVYKTQGEAIQGKQND